jgi:hypothetical protein
MRPLRRVASFAALVVLVPLVPLEGRAQTTVKMTEEACAGAAREAQSLRGAGKYARARGSFAACGAEECPDAVRAFCVKTLQKVDEEAPTVVIVARDGAGREIADVGVWVDGARVAERIDGRPLPLDPGSHRLRFERVGSPAVEREVFVRVGEKARPIEILIGSSSKAVPQPEPPERTSSVPTVSWVLGGVSLVALGGFGYFGVRGWSQRSDLADDPCRATSTCDATSVRTSWYVADASLVVAVLAMGGAVWAYLATPSRAAPVSKATSADVPGPFRDF